MDVPMADSQKTTKFCKEIILQLKKFSLMHTHALKEAPRNWYLTSPPGSKTEA